jgi:hypothetical protein
MPRPAGALAVLTAAAVVLGGCVLTDERNVEASLEELRERPGPGLYYVGETFEGLPLTDISAAGPQVTFFYGDCEPPPDEGGCAPPLEVQIWPIERRPPGAISSMIECRKVAVRGASGAFYGSDLDLYVGDQTVVVFADSQPRALRAAEALRPVDADRASDQDLAAPAIDAEGPLARCSGG